jgi:hypothetical protein
VDGLLVELPAEQAVIRRMTRLRKQGLSLRAIAAAMQEAGVQISHMGVKDALAAATRARGGG